MDEFGVLKRVGLRRSAAIRDGFDLPFAAECWRLLRPVAGTLSVWSVTSPAAVSAAAIEDSVLSDAVSGSDTRPSASSGVSVDSDVRVRCAVSFLPQGSRRPRSPDRRTSVCERLAVRPSTRHAEARFARRSGDAERFCEISLGRGGVLLIARSVSRSVDERSSVAGCDCDPADGSAGDSSDESVSSVSAGSPCSSRTRSTSSAVALGTSAASSAMDASGFSAATSSICL